MAAGLGRAGGSRTRGSGGCLAGRGGGAGRGLGAACGMGPAWMRLRGRGLGMARGWGGDSRGSRDGRPQAGPSGWPPGGVWGGSPPEAILYFTWSNSFRGKYSSAIPSGLAPPSPPMAPGWRGSRRTKGSSTSGSPRRAPARGGLVGGAGGHRRPGPRHPHVRVGPRCPAPAVPAGHRRRRELAAARRRPRDHGPPRPHPVRRRAGAGGRHGAEVPDRPAGRAEPRQPRTARRLQARPRHRRADQGGREPRLHRLARRRAARGPGDDRAAAGRESRADGAGQRGRGLAAAADRSRRRRADQ